MQVRPSENRDRLRPQARNLIQNITWLVAFLLVVLGSQTGANAQVIELAGFDLWQPSGDVNTIVPIPPEFMAGGEIQRKVLLGGDFSYVGPETGGGVTIEAASGLIIAAIPEMDGRVLAAVSDGAGGWFLGG